ncbi:hypothetical protein C162_01937 [Paenibacillus sp. FSL R7-269]|uniref:hypothetical protein n=1 Tax=Paenibacillus sp. FSL R7-269 TaxID=1226755 RepID=UPI0003E1C6F1|nr:hypothetical protein [Paenibacillus sp. FSL R7-269]ETT56164.1 hypothetical protein C162_01937 [Paenibacillus sp. FSL R7-269]
MKLVMILGILLLSASIIVFEFRGSKDKKTRKVIAGITLATAGLTILLLLQPGLPGPTELVKLLFGRIDLIMK